jgi:hypothetical protein
MASATRFLTLPNDEGQILSIARDLVLAHFNMDEVLISLRSGSIPFILSRGECDVGDADISSWSDGTNTSAIFPPSDNDLYRGVYTPIAGLDPLV